MSAPATQVAVFSQKSLSAWVYHPGDVVMTLKGKVINDDTVFTYTNNANNIFGLWWAYLPWFALGGVVAGVVCAPRGAHTRPTQVSLCLVEKTLKKSSRKMLCRQMATAKLCEQALRVCQYKLHTLRKTKSLA
jgi:hypothetical protein